MTTFLNSTFLNSLLFTFSFYGLYKLLEIKSYFTVNKLLIKFNNKNAKMPYRATPQSAGLDLFSCETGIIEPHSKRLIDIGISIVIPFKYYGRIASRSGLAVKNSIDVGAGVIDSDYRGNVSVVLFNHGDERFTFNKGDKIAQLIIEKIAILDTVNVQELDDDTLRGEKGFGSSGISNFNIGINYNANIEETYEKETSDEETCEKETSDEESYEKETTNEETSDEETTDEETCEKETSNEETGEKETSDEETCEKETTEEENFHELFLKIQ
jgi:dUTP pyrophosphatase